MSSKASQGSRLVLLGAFGIVIAMFVCGFVLFLVFEASHSPADELPANETIAFFHNVTTADRVRLLKAIPSLAVFPELPANRSVDVSLLSLPNESVGWAIFELHKKPDGILNMFTGDKYSVTSSSPDVEELLRKKTVPLSASSEFVTLTSAPEDRSWAFLRTDLFKESSAKGDSALLQQLSVHAIFLTWSPAALRVTVIPSWKTSVGKVLSPFILSPAPDVILSTAAPGEIYDALQRTLPTPQKIILEGIARTWWKDIAGNDGFAGDFPLLLGNPLLYAERTGSGTPVRRFLAETVMTQDTTALLDRLHLGTRTNLRPYKVTRRELTLGFASTLVEVDPSLIQDVTESKNGWLLRQTSQKRNAAMFLSATKDGQVLFGNDPEWMKQALKPSVTAMAFTPPAGSVSVLAEGVLRKDALTSVLKTMDLSLTERFVDAFGPEGDTVSIYASRSKNALTFTLGRIATE